MMIILKPKGISQDINEAFEDIQRTLKIKGYELYPMTLSHVYFSKIISGVGSFGWDYFLKKVSFLNKGDIKIKKESAHMLIYAHFSVGKGLLFYSTVLTLVSVLFWSTLNLPLLKVSFLLIVALIALLISCYLMVRCFLKSLIRESK